MLTVRSLGSGSSGNALLVEEGASALLVDCGIGARALAAGLGAAGHRLADLTAVLITHEHADHVRALPQVERARLQLVATRGTAAAAGLAPSLHEEARAGQPLRFGAFAITPLPVSHDAAEPCAFQIEGATGALLVATDLGCPAPAWRDRLAAVDLIVLEANHDEAMLRSGPYPARLKRRVLSERGHLSNADCAAFLADALSDVDHRSPTVWLAHLSRTNNRPALAQATVARGLAERGLAVPLLPLPRHGADTIWRPGGDHGRPAQLPLLLGT